MKTPNGEFSLCRKLYKDIINGYTYIPYHKIYVKHFKEIDIGEINESKQTITEETKAKGLLTEEEKIKILIDSDHWSIEKEQEIQSLSEQIANHQQAKTKLFIKSQLNAVQHQIEQKEKALNVILNEKNSIVGLTVEKYTEKASSEEIIRFALFSNSECNDPLYSAEDYEELDSKELDKLITLYSSTMIDLSEKRLKMISASTFFMNALMLCKNNPFIFFGFPVTQLTNFQMEIFSQGLSYKGVLEKGNTPSFEVNENLEKLVEWYESSGNMEKIKEKATERDGSTYMGATKEELRMLSKGDNIVDLEKEAEKKGGNLDMNDFIRIHSGD
jgi:hypothetical protein